MENRKLPSAIVIGIVGFVLLTLFGSSMFYFQYLRLLVRPIPGLKPLVGSNFL